MNPAPPVNDQLPAEVKSVPAGLKLLLLQIVHRHGERTPIGSDSSGFVPPNASDYSKNCIKAPTTVGFLKNMSDPTNSGLLPPLRINGDGPYAGFLNACIDGQLTDTGRTHLTRVGDMYRRAYMGAFLPSFWNDRGLVYLRSSNFQRTMESLEALLEGMYPTTCRSGDVSSSPLVVHTRAFQYQDNMFLDFNCPRLQELRDLFEKESLHRIKNNSSMWSPKLKSLLQDSNPVSAIFTAHDACASALAHNKKLNVTPTDVEHLADATADLWFGNMTNKPEYPKLMIGRLCHEMMELTEDHVASVVDKPSPRITQPEFSLHNYTDKISSKLPKIAIYSGHDTTIAPMLGALGIWHRKWPIFASNLAIELWQSENSRSESDIYVRVLNNGVAQKLPQCAARGSHLRDNPTFCTYNAFMQHMKTMISNEAEHRKLCGTRLEP